MNPIAVGVRLVAGILLVVLCGCGGGGGGGSSDAGTPVYTFGAVTAVGSVVINGIRFEDSAADISGDDSPRSVADIRKIGVMLRIRGRLYAGGRSGTADRIEIENELRGPIDSLSPPDTFTALGQTVLVDGGTVFEDTTGLSGADPLAVSDVVEVHGSRDSAGRIRATRVERLGAPAVDELRGWITARTGTSSGTVTIGGSDFTYDGSTAIVPPGVPFDAGTLVEVHLAGTYITRLEVESQDEPGLQPSEGMESRIEGFVSGFVDVGSTFFVGGFPVDASAATFEGGAASDLANDVRIEAEGTLSGGVLSAREIEFRDSVEIRSVVQSGAVASGDVGAFVILGKSFAVTGSTVNQEGNIDPGDSVRVRGFLNADGTTLTATRIESLGPIDPDGHILQCVVTSRNSSTLHLSMLGIDVNAAGWNGAGGGVNFRGFEGMPMGPMACFGAIVEGVTIVQARGTPGPGTLTANEIQLE